MVEIVAVLFVIGMMLVLYLDFIGRNNGTKQSINVDVGKKQEDRLTFNEKRIVYKYILKDCLLNQFRTVLPKQLQRPKSNFFTVHFCDSNSNDPLADSISIPNDRNN